VQSINVQKNLAVMETAYKDFASGFAMFNLQFKLPEAVAKVYQTPFVLFCSPFRDRLPSRLIILDEEEMQANSCRNPSRFSPPPLLFHFKAFTCAGSNWACEAFDGTTEATEVFYGHFFVLFVTIVGTVVWHQTALWLLKRMDFPVPGFFVFPKLEITTFLGLFLGVVDVSFGVLSNERFAWGWLLLACAELVAACSAMLWFFSKGVAFSKQVKWVPANNIRQFKTFDSLTSTGTAP
jgi:hypothetical protein